MGYGGKGCLEIEQESLVCAVCRVAKFGGIGILSNTNYVNLCSIFFLINFHCETVSVHFQEQETTLLRSHDYSVL